jgi:hypothetical protein
MPNWATTEGGHATEYGFVVWEGRWEEIGTIPLSPEDEEPVDQPTGPSDLSVRATLGSAARLPLP